LPYSLKPAESFPDGLKRVAAAELNASARTLLRAHTAHAVHEARTGVKKARAIVRLVRGELGDAFRTENAELRNAGHSLSELRDAAALLETLRDLPGRPLLSLRADLNRRKKAAERARVTAATVKRTAAILRRSAKRVAEWSLSLDGVSAIEPGLAASYRRGRKALALALRDDTPQAWHDFRKRVKDHWHHVRLLRDVAGRRLESRKKPLRKLETALGSMHNLFVLRAAITGEAPVGNPDDRAAAVKRIDKAEKNLQREARSLARTLYRQKPREFLRHVRPLF
jgi:CHAD domain-containing protein